MLEVDIKFNNVEDIQKFVEITSNCDYDIDLSIGKYVIDGKSIMGIFTLSLDKPIKMVAHSDRCDDLVKKLKEYHYL
ncbi:MAG TPA: HPr family phosphocarrier protein [Candidatus Merdenecus merdavium]|nr:HPr family phosphocarrier protein [Candidatus Merdenecus merdavium]